jgi:hypothetical protein
MSKDDKRGLAAARAQILFADIRAFNEAVALHIARKGIAFFSPVWGSA